MNVAAIDVPVPTTGPQELQPRAIPSLLILFFFMILSYLDRQIIALVVDPIKHDMGISDFQVSLLQGLAFALCFCVATGPMGWIADRYNRRLLIFCGITCWSFATIGCGLATTYEQLFVARFLVGIGEASLAPATYSILSDLFPPRRLTIATGTIGSASSVGSGSAIVIGGLLIGWLGTTAYTLPLLGSMQPWQMIFIMVGVPGVLASFLVFVIPETRKPRPPSAKGSEGPGYLTWLRQNAWYVGGLALGTTFSNILAFAGAAWGAVYLSRHFGLNMSEIGIKMGIAQTICGFIGFVGGGWLVDRLSGSSIRNPHYIWLLFMATCMSILGPITYLWAQDTTTVFILLGLIQLLVPFSSPAFAHVQLATPPQFRARTIGLIMLTFMSVGMIGGSSGVAFLTDYVFQDPGKVGWSIATVYAIAGPAGLLCFALSYRAANRARFVIRPEWDRIAAQNN